MHIKDFTEALLPDIISLLELIGISVITAGALYSFYCCLRTVLLKERVDFRLILLNSMALGLEFKMAAEILKTVLVQTIHELFMLGAVILLRTVISLIIHFEMKFELHAPHEGAKK